MTDGQFVIISARNGETILPEQWNLTIRRGAHIQQAMVLNRPRCSEVGIESEHRCPYPSCLGTVGCPYDRRNQGIWLVCSRVVSYMRGISLNSKLILRYSSTCGKWSRVSKTPGQPTVLITMNTSKPNLSNVTSKDSGAGFEKQHVEASLPPILAYEDDISIFRRIVSFDCPRPILSLHEARNTSRSYPQHALAGQCVCWHTLHRVDLEMREEGHGRKDMQWRTSWIPRIEDAISLLEISLQSGMLQTLFHTWVLPR